MGFVSVVGAVVMTTGADPNLLGGSPLWGSLLDESGGLLGGQPLFGGGRGRCHARRRQPDRPRQRLLHRPLQDAGLHGDAGVADALLVGRHLAHPVAEHRQPAGGVLAARLRRPRLLLFRREGRGDDQAARHPPLRHLSDDDRAGARARRGDPPAVHRLRPLHLRRRHQPEGGGNLRRAGAARHHARLRLLRTSAPRSPRSSIRPASAAAGRRSAQAACSSTSSARR